MEWIFCIHEGIEENRNKSNADNNTNYFRDYKEEYGIYLIWC